MAFRHGKNAALLFDQYALTSYFKEASITRDVDTSETTTFGQSGKTYIAGLQAGKASLSGLYDGATNAVDQVLSAALGSSTDNVVTICPDLGLTEGYRVNLLANVLSNYEVSSPVADVVSIKAEFSADGGIDSGILLAQRTASAGGQTTGVNNTAATSNGYVAHLHMTANAQTGATVVKVQYSADGVTAWTDLVIFTSVGAGVLTAERKTGTGSVPQYLRVLWTVAGSGSVTFSVALARR